MAKIYTFVVLFLLVNGALQQISVHREDKNIIKIGNFLHLHRHRLDVTPQASLELAGEMKCVTSCVKTDGCYSVNAKKLANGKVLCELLNRTKYQYPGNLTSDENCDHWFAVGMSACAPNPCGPPRTICITKDSVSVPFACDYHKNHNFALLKPTAQSSNFSSPLGPLFSKYAVDGIKVGSCIGAGFPGCSATNFEIEKWWRVDLQIAIPVARVGITNRKDWVNTLHNFEIKIGNSLTDEGRQNPKCGDRHVVPHKEAKVIHCSPPLTGRYVVIQSFVYQHLVLIEVEVFAAGP